MYHQNSSQLLSKFQDQKEAFIQNVENQQKESNLDFEIVNFPDQDQSQTNQNIENFIRKDGLKFEKDSGSEKRDLDVQRLLEPITAVIESILNHSIDQYQSNQSSLAIQQASNIQEEILDIIRQISYALTSKSASPCFHMQMLKLLRVILTE